MIVTLGVFLATILAAELLSWAILATGAHPLTGERARLESERPLSPHEWPESLSAIPETSQPYFPEEPPGRYSGIFKFGEHEINGLRLPQYGAKNSIDFIDHRNGKIAWSTTATLDENGHRIYPLHEERRLSAKRHIFAFGCSLTFGQGVDDDDTFLAWIARRSPELVTYNAALPGGGPTEALALARWTPILKDLQPRQGVGIYVMFSDHLRRFGNALSLLGGWRRYGGLTFKETPDGDFHILGPPRATTPIRWAVAQYWALSAFMELFAIDFPRVDDQLVDQYFRMIQQIRSEYWKQTDPHNPFLIVVYPFKYDSEIYLEGLRRSGLDFIDYSRTSPAGRFRQPHAIPGEGHPSKEFHEQFATVLQRDLEFVWKGTRP